MKTNKIILGTVQFGLDYGINNSVGKLPDQKIFEILDFAFESGIKILDTAESYGNAHEIIATYHKQSKNRFNIISKYSALNTNYPKSLLERVTHHCNNFDIKNLYAYMFHSFNEFLQLQTKNPNELKALAASKLVKKIGVSVYSNEQIEYLLDIPEISLIQLPFNLLDNESQRATILKKAKKNGKEIHVRSVFLQGLFFKNIEKLTGNLIDLKTELSEIERIINKNNQNITTLALQYPLQKDYIDRILIGVDNMEQLKSNLSILNSSIPNSVIKELDNIIVTNKVRLNPSTWKK